MLKKPLFVVDMTLYEFLHILDLINDVMAKFPEAERKKELRKKIMNMFGKIPIEEGKQPRNLAGGLNKITSNYMITINQLGLVDNLDDFKKLYSLYDTKRTMFFNELRKLLLNKGKWNEYIEAISRINRLGKFKNKTEYIELVANEMHKKYPDVTISGHKKQLQYTRRWMEHEKIAFLGEFKPNYGFEIIESNIND